MHTTASGGLQPAPRSDLFARHGDERAPGRLPLRQQWKLPAGNADARTPAPSGTPGQARPKFALVARGSEGEIRALNERALREGRQAVKLAHGDAVAFGPPSVHTYLDPVLRVPMEPLMFVKVDARREHLDPILQELRSRDARMHEVELQSRRAILRAEGRLAALLGFEEAVLAIGTHSAQVFSWLVRYEAAARPQE